MLNDLLEKTKNKDFSVCVIGLGRVGLPLATIFASKGIKTYGIDINNDRVKLINAGKCPFHDPSLQNMLTSVVNQKYLVADNDLKNISEQIDAIFVTVGTPTTQDNMVDYSQFYGALNEVCKLDLKNTIILLRSTLPPLTTTEIGIPFLELNSSLIAGKDFAIGMFPERILEGHAIEEIQSLPEIMGGINQITNDIATEIFRVLNPSKDFLYTTPLGAELAKLFSNIYRYISFALSNEFAIWGEKFGIDASEIIKIANYNYSRSNIPMPGFCGGPCLSKDGIFLDNNTTFTSIVSTAWKLNESIPIHVVENIKILSGPIFNKKISVLGLSFKSGSDDLRQSPAVKLVEILKSHGSQVVIHDPHVKNTSSLADALRSPDILIIATNHKEFKTIVNDIAKSRCKLIYDVWSMFKKEDFPNSRYIKFGEGLS